MASKLVKRMIFSFRRFSSRNLVTFKTNFFYHRYSYSRIYSLSRKMIYLLKERGIKKGDRIIICSFNCPQYFVSMLACIFYGAVAVPLDYGTSKRFISQIRKETDAKLLMTSVYKDTGTDRKETLFMEELDDLLSGCREITANRDTKDEDLLEILYTSGTTSDPKGVLLTHKNLYSNLDAILKVLPLKPSFRFMSIIPLSHSFEQIGGFFALIGSGGQTIHMMSRRPSDIKNAFRKMKVNTLVTVPAFLDILKKGIEEKAKESGSLEKLEKMMQLSLDLPYSLRKILFSKVHKKLGSRLNFAVSGGAPLSAESERFWNALGVKIIQGYGLTETSPVLTANRLNSFRQGSAGMLLPGVTIKISDEGEILAKGDNITQGYYKNRKATEELFDEKGWLKTGDIGSFDEEGFLYIKGRKKNMILKSSGLNIYPEDIEKVLDAEKGVKKSCVIGLPKKGDVLTLAVLLMENKVSREEAAKIIDNANSRLESHQQIQDFYVWKEKDFPRTHTLKIKRALVLDKVSGESSPEKGSSGSKDMLIDLLSKITGISQERINEKDRLYADLKFDSIKVIELSLLIEERFKAVIDETKISKDTSVKDLRELIDNPVVPKKSRLRLSKKYFNPLFLPIRAITHLIYYGVISYFCKVQVLGRKNIKGIRGPLIIIFNHASYFDAPVVVKYLPLKIRARLAVAAAADHFFVKKKKLFDHRVITRRLLQLFVPTYPMSRDKDIMNRSSIKQSLEFTGEIISMGYSLLISPEGTRTLTGKMGEFKQGIGLIVKESGLPVLPIKLKGMYEIYPKGAKFPKRGSVKLIFGKKVKFSFDESVVSITEKLEKLMRDM